MAEQLCKEIQDDLTELVDDMKQALDYLFDVIEETLYVELDHIQKNKVQEARDIYHKHFVC